ncbi:MAG: hypothetical protein ACOY82_14135 [Pseudomonadota bacterium]
MTPRHVLIATTARDVHATIVRRALQELGHSATLWMTGDLPETASASWTISNDDDCALSARQCDGPVLPDAADVFWFRRTMQAGIDREMHPADHAMALDETRAFVRGLLTTTSDRCISVNDYRAAMAAEVKHTQLLAAKRIGLSIPDTLISNDPARIREFIRRGGDNGTIYKPFNTAIWESPSSVAFSYTAVVAEDALPSDATLRLTPGIFQRRIDKACELRVTCMGRRTIAVRLDSQAVAGAEIDWRVSQNASLRPSLVVLPPAIEAACQALLAALGLRFGCIDFVVTPQGEYVFLEINQMGQFLWVEDANPGIPMLDAFVAFLLDPDCATPPSESVFGLSFHEFAKEGQEDLMRLQRIHRTPRQSASVHTE